MLKEFVKIAIGKTDGILYYLYNGTWQKLTNSTSSCFIFDEIPIGARNGINRNYTLLNIPILGSVRLYKNGGRLSVNDGDFTIDGLTITLTLPLEDNDFLTADYIK